MRVIIGDTVYYLKESQAKGVLNSAKKYVDNGIYAVSKDKILELKKEVYSGKSQLKKAINEYKKYGFKVYYNEV